MNRRPANGESASALSRELSDFLIEFSIGLHKNAIYPPGHPLLEGATSSVAQRVEALLKDRPSLSLGVAREQLIIDGVMTDEGHPVLHDLAQRLHRHHLGALKFTQGVSAAEIADVLTLLAVEAGRREKPLGLEGPEILARWPHIRLFPLTFGQLQLLDEQPLDAAAGADQAEMRTDGRAAQLWIGLARASIAAEATGRDPIATEITDPRAVAKAIDEREADAAYDQVVVGYMLQIAEQLKTKGEEDDTALRKRMSSLVASLHPRTLGRLLKMGGDQRQRRQFVRDATEGMAVDAVVELVQAAASTSGQTISHSLVRMLSKLAVHAGDGDTRARDEADGALRDQVQRLISDWKIDDPNPDGYRVALEKMSRVDRPAPPGEGTLPCEPERLLEMGIEIEVLGEPVWRSLDTLASRDDLSPLLDVLEDAPEGWAREALWRHVATIERLQQQLERVPVSMVVVERLVARMRLAAAEPMLDALELADDRLAPAFVEMLAGLGIEIAPLLVERIRGVRWTVQRQFLLLLGKVGVMPEGFPAQDFLRHGDSAVRREAVRLLLKFPDSREGAIVMGLSDSDERIVRLALGSAMTNCPREAATILLARADDDGLSADLRALEIRALASFESDATLAFLLRHTVTRTAFLRRRVLAPASKFMLAALAGLSTHWHDHPEAIPVLALAERSSDPEIRDAASRRTAAS